jgi:hypothetical protein
MAAFIFSMQCTLYNASLQRSAEFELVWGYLFILHDVSERYKQESITTIRPMTVCRMLLVTGKGRVLVIMTSMMCLDMVCNKVFQEVSHYDHPFFAPMHILQDGTPRRERTVSPDGKQYAPRCGSQQDVHRDVAYDDLFMLRYGRQTMSREDEHTMWPLLPRGRTFSVELDWATAATNTTRQYWTNHQAAVPREPSDGDKCSFVDESRPLGQSPPSAYLPALPSSIDARGTISPIHIISQSSLVW